jgi:N-[(2S)-2-amino-2-carboxyethyl]-L-glutamate dehydrogenase
MDTSDILILKGEEVRDLLTGQEAAIIAAVQTAYEAHRREQSSLPQSTFLRFPDSARNRIIALPAYLGGEMGGAGIKWVSSFPDNIGKGMNRASAVVILNSPHTGLPYLIAEGSIISAARTAASAALAARTLHAGRAVTELGVLGCGVINFEIVRSVTSVFPGIKTLFLYDLSAARADLFRERCESTFSGVVAEVVKDVHTLLRASSLLSIATTAIEPYLTDFSGVAAGSTVLHISLRDLAPQIILNADNVVDDVDHVCRAQTSVHLAEQLMGNRDFIRCTLADVTMGNAPARADSDAIVVFSPFGLGVLDIAVSRLVYDLALKSGKGSVIRSFLPDAWGQRT